MKKENNESFLREGNEVFFFYDHDFHKLFSEGSKERNDKRIAINCKKDNFDYFYYLHKVILIKLL